MDDEIKRLKRFIKVSWCLLLLIIIGLAVWASVQLKSFSSALNIALARPSEIVKGINGTDGLQGLSGVQGIAGQNGSNGQDGQSVTPDEIATAVSSYLQAHPVVVQAAQGIQGPVGAAAPTLVAQVDPTTCQLETQYVGDQVWKVLAQLPVPCAPVQTLTSRIANVTGGVGNDITAQ